MSNPEESPASIAASSRNAGQADVCLLLEGTWPYVRGGVSTWVHQILTSMPDVRFSVVFIGAEKDAAGAPKYDPPANLVNFQEVFLFDPSNAAETNGGNASRGKWVAAHQALRRLLLDESDGRSEAESDRLLAEAFLALSHLAGQVPFDRFWSHSETWNLLQEVYVRHFEQVPFIECFWNLRFLCEPVWRLLQLTDQLPDARVYHAVSTGYAGLLGALAARSHRNGRFLLSEHGIYVRERISELLRAEWTGYAGRNGSGCGEIAPLRRLWIDFFIEIGRFSYHSAGTIVSLFQRNADIQAEFGAPSKLIRVIPNGVKLERFDPIRENRRQKREADPNRKIVGFFGRVVAIKDVKTLLRAARLTIDAMPDTRFLLVGPTDEDPEYFRECQRLTKELDLDRFVHFGGPATPEQALPEFDLMVLSSVSEGLPFAVLEAFASGMPVVSTDVGSCPELIEGRPDESPVFGPAGRIVPVGAPASLAAALIELLTDRDLQNQLGDAGLSRVRASYAEPDIISAYREIYRELAETPTAPSPQPAGQTTA
ncbi:MAG: GT4 family glycosyltransferase PelF [Verrucomicrobiae bacterium]|nr:GT4 family glycosyltransferase PelF [Verrucomicrobiae bacterium]